jgi:hypothetical protein
MKKITFLVVVLVVVASPLTGQTSAAAKRASSPCGFECVNTYIYDYSADGTQTMLLRSDDVGGTGLYGVYLTTTGTSPITSQIASGGNWGLTLSGQTISPFRTVYVPPTTFAQGPYWTGAWIYNYCQDQFGNKVQMENITTGSTNCGLAINFNPYGNTNPQGTTTQPTYKLIMGPNLLAHLQANGWGVSTAPATGQASVSCNTVNSSTNQCVAWTITNNADSQLADLYQENYTKRGAQLVYVGQYQSTFRIYACVPGYCSAPAQ